MFKYILDFLKRNHNEHCTYYILCEYNFFNTKDYIQFGQDYEKSVLHLNLIFNGDDIKIIKLYRKNTKTNRVKEVLSLTL